MVTKDFWVLLAMVLYFAAMLTIGFVYSKRSNSSTKQYFAGGRGATTFNNLQKGKNTW